MVTPEERLRELRERERVAIAAEAAPLASPAATVSWAGVWSGFMVTMGSLLILTAVGLAVGISVLGAIPGSAADTQNWSVAAALWEFCSLLISLFIGGMVATRTPAFAVRPSRAVIGMLVWVLSTAAVSLAGAIRFAFATAPVLDPTGVAPGTMTTVPQPQLMITGWVTVFVLVASLIAAMAGAAAGYRSYRVVRT